MLEEEDEDDNDDVGNGGGESKTTNTTNTTNTTTTTNTTNTTNTTKGTVGETDKELMALNHNYIPTVVSLVPRPMKWTSSNVVSVDMFQSIYMYFT